MTYRNFHLLFLQVIPVFCLFATPVLAQELDIEYAEHARLSTDSLLMDITAMPGGGYVAVGERGHIVVSDDGKAWSQAEVVPTRSTLTSVAERGGRLWAAGHDSVIVTSGDGGMNWTQQFFEPDRQQPIMDLVFFDDLNGMAIGAYGLALITADGGATWTDHVINDEEWHNNAILEFSDTDFLVAGEAGFSYRSHDGGETWETIEMPYPGSMFGIVRGQDNCVMVFGLRGHVQRSCDFGDNWTELDTGTQSSITSAVHTDGRTIMVGNSGLVMIYDGDGNFSTRYHSSGVDFASIVETGDGRYLLAGEDGIHHYPEISSD
jgi:photosystem II stability/assembly factor-like uncharacterized protein